MKTFRGTIRNWQLHTLSDNLDLLKSYHPEATTDKIYMITGTIVEDPTGRRKPGDHTRTSVVVKLSDNHVETANSFYNLQDKGGDIFNDLGMKVAAIFY